ncbi:MarR family winged helix-turn-helix transcriptional regulator [Spirochaeta cellobiosiphila]|uniref:MarR family winged helix-turn-helix transcriptional regulator n=1 Tax=Spirochaeta cellobiosiphila TaxID=504483 RepID=UPI0004281382|nr:MarR family winged helix-turn-helix transcriptional regulator [Spirochaeta cellobiosiphila]
MNTKRKQQIQAINSSMSRANELYGRWAKQHGLNYNALLIFYILHEKKEYSQKRICEEWLLPKQTVNTVCKSLEKSGYITTETNKEDRRSKTIRLTEKGQEYTNDVISKLYKIEERVMEHMGNDLCEMFVKTNELFAHYLSIEVNND